MRGGDSGEQEGQEGKQQSGVRSHTAKSLLLLESAFGHFGVGLHPSR